MVDSVENNRASPRFISKAIILVFSENEKEPVMGSINNISAGGVSLNLEVKSIKSGFKIGCRVICEMPVKMFGMNSNESLKLQAEIKRVTNLGKTLSCQFQNLKDSEIAVLNKGLRIIEVINKISSKSVS